MKSIEKLRQFLEDQFGSDRFAIHGYGYTQGMAIAKLIEKEIAERFMELPVDADGVPIHLGDLLVRGDDDKHFCHGIGKPSLDVMDEHCNWWRSECFRHVKPRTLENIVADAIQYGHNGITGDRIEGKVAEFCAEIRELFGGDAE